MSNNIEGKVVVITGASSGLGEATARLLSREGAVVVLGARRIARIRSLQEDLARAGGKALAIQTDVTRSEEVNRLVKGTVENFGRIDVMIGNAGLMAHSPLDRAKVDDWNRMIDVNLKGVLYGIAAALPHMQRQRSGHFINVSSISGHKVRPTTAVYAATKHGIRAISEGLRQEVKPYNIRVTVISPGAIQSELPTGLTEPDIAEKVLKLYDVALPAESFARIVAFTIAQPDDVDVNEVVFRPTKQEL